MLESDHTPQGVFRRDLRGPPPVSTANSGSLPLEARVKPEYVHLYPGVDPKLWHKVVQKGEYQDELEGLWIQVTDWVTYVLARHFDVQTSPEVN